MSDDGGLFADLRVVEVASMFMAPTAATILADFGAEVIKVESPDGDNLRRLHTFKGMPESDIDYVYMMVNRNKKGIVLDLKRPEAAEALRRLIASADIFVTNYRPKAQRRLKISWDDVRDFNRRRVATRRVDSQDLSEDDDSDRGAADRCRELTHSCRVEGQQVDEQEGDQQIAAERWYAGTVEVHH